MGAKLKVFLYANCLSLFLHLLEHYTFSSVQHGQSDLHFTVKVLLYMLCLAGGTSCSVILQEMDILKVDDRYKQFCRFMLVLHLYALAYHNSFALVKRFASWAKQRKCKMWLAQNILSGIFHVLIEHRTTMDEGSRLFLKALLRLSCAVGGSIGSAVFHLYGYMEEDKEYKTYLRVILAFHILIFLTYFIAHRANKTAPALTPLVRDETQHKEHARLIRF